jgi:hypothetical protein
MKNFVSIAFHTEVHQGCNFFYFVFIFQCFEVGLATLLVTMAVICLLHNARCTVLRTDDMPNVLKLSDKLSTASDFTVLCQQYTVFLCDLIYLLRKIVNFLLPRHGSK